jgi:hypothetical protein
MVVVCINDSAVVIVVGIVVVSTKVSGVGVVG